MKKLLIATILIFMSSILNASTSQRIKWIRSEYNKIERDVNQGVYRVKSKEFVYEGGVMGADAKIYIDRAGRVRKYMIEEGTDDSVESAEYYYDKSGKMFFSFLHYGTVGGLHRDIRSYYDRYGNLIERKIDSNADWDIKKYYRIRNPLKHFRNFKRED